MGSMHVEREVALGRAWRPGVEVSDWRVDRRRHFSFRHQFIIPYLLTVHDRSRGVTACCLLLTACCLLLAACLLQLSPDPSWTLSPYCSFYLVLKIIKNM